MGFGAGLVPLHSPLLRESSLVSFPPLINMLKFSGFSRLISGRNRKTVVKTARVVRRAGPSESRSSAESSAELNSRVHVSTPAAAPALGLRLPLRRRRRREQAKQSTAPPSPRFSSATPNARNDRAFRDKRYTDPETGVTSGIPEVAICVQDFDVQCVLQFTLVNAAGCALHRHTSRVIHRIEW